MTYAKGTSVSIDKSKAAIEKMLGGYGCTQFSSGWANVDGQHFAHVSFQHGETSIMLGLPMPNPNEFAFWPLRRGQWQQRKRTVAQIEEAYEAEKRRRWRSLLLVIKAKLEAVDCGISTLEREFLADVVLPNGRTLGEWAVPKLAEIQSGRLLLPAHREER